MKTKYVCRGLISLYVNFQNNRTISSTNLHVKNCRWGGGRKKSPICLTTERGGRKLEKRRTPCLIWRDLVWS